MSSTYWRGEVRAHIDIPRMEGVWNGRDGVGDTVRFMNRAFDIYFNSHQRITACPDDAYREELMADLHAAGQTGAGAHPIQHMLGNIRPDDLEEAFLHLEGTGGCWRDNAVVRYTGGPCRVFEEAIVACPPPFERFMSAVDGRMTILDGVVREFDTLALDFDRACTRRDWESVGSILNAIKDGAERVTALMWYSPIETTRGMHATTFLSHVSALHSGLTDYQRCLSAGMDPTESGFIGAFSTVVNLVPVLGSFYGRAVSMIPAAVTLGEALRRRRYHICDQIAGGHFSTR